VVLVVYDTEKTVRSFPTLTESRTRLSARTKLNPPSRYEPDRRGFESHRRACAYRGPSCAGSRSWRESGTCDTASDLYVSLSVIPLAISLDPFNNYAPA
jgi:hypothetical protein